MNDPDKLKSLYDIIDDLRANYARLLKENKELREEVRRLKKA
jgi:regulator of replication initiation timing